MRSLGLRTHGQPTHDLHRSNSCGLAVFEVDVRLQDPCVIIYMRAQSKESDRYWPAFLSCYAASPNPAAVTYTYITYGFRV